MATMVVFNILTEDYILLCMVRCLLHIYIYIYTYIYIYIYIYIHIYIFSEEENYRILSHLIVVLKLEGFLVNV